MRRKLTAGQIVITIILALFVFPAAAVYLPYARAGRPDTFKATLIAIAVTYIAAFILISVGVPSGVIFPLALLSGFLLGAHFRKQFNL